MGTTATAVATRVPKPVVVVPPDAVPPTGIKRVLVPLEGTAATSLAPRSLVRLGPGRELDVVVLHVLGPNSLPSFVDQPQYWHEVWTREFLARYCPWGIDEVGMLVRVGRREQLIADTAREAGCDLIALGWSQDLSEDLARVIRATLGRSCLPVALIPVRREPVAGAAELAGSGGKALL